MRLLRLPAILAIVACSEQEPPPPPVEVPSAGQPRAASFVTLMRPIDEHTLGFRVSAPGAHPLYLDNCNGAFSWGLERQAAGTWKPAWTVATNACHSAPLVIPAGESREFTEAVTLDRGATLPSDRYRVAVYGLYSIHDSEDHSANTEVPHGLRLSEPFLFGPLTAP